METSSSILGFHLQKAPTLANELTAVVNLYVSRGKATFCDFGIANAQSAASSDPQVIIQEAKNNALRNMQTDIQHLNDVRLSDRNTHSLASEQSIPQKLLPQPLCDNKDNLNGGGDKAASQKQKKLIMDKCNKISVDCNKLCLDKFHCRIDELTGTQADKIIKDLMNNPRR